MEHINIEPMYVMADSVRIELHLGNLTWRDRFKLMLCLFLGRSTRLSGAVVGTTQVALSLTQEYVSDITAAYLKAERRS